MAQNPNNALAVSQGDAELAAIAATKNDLSAMTEPQRAQLYGAVCRSIGLNPLTSPFEYIRLNGKLTLYAKKGATDQIRDIRGISITDTSHQVIDGVLITTVVATDKSGRTDSDMGAVAIKGLQGEALANAYMKALTKAKRRVTLSLAGLGFLDESEVETVPSAQPVNVNHQTGRIEQPHAAALASARGTDRESALDRLVGIVKAIGCSADDLDLWARDKGKSDLNAMSTASLIRMADQIDADPERARDYFNDLRAAEEQRAELQQLNDQLNAQIDGEIVDADGVIHQGELVTADVKRPGYGDA